MKSHKGSKLGPIAFTLKINQLPQITSSHEREQTCEASDDEDTVMFIDDTSLSKVIDTSRHSSGSSTSNTERNVNKVRRFANDEKMDANGENVMKC